VPKKNRYFREHFTYNNSGVVLEPNGIMFVKGEIKVPNSNSCAAGARVGIF
tara:strand:+ start:755 stop:907 length:153 start_codon:yes stop_codon:yes gene_type:complete